MKLKKFFLATMGVVWSVCAVNAALQSTVNVTGTISNSSKEYDASSLVYANCKVTNNSKVKFVSCDRITLKSGFRVNSNSEFVGQVRNCNGLRSGSVLTDDFDEAVQERNEYFFLYPNPTDGEFSVSFAAEDVDYNLIVTDIAGKVVYSTSGTGREQAVNLDGKASGIYFVHITAGDKSYTEKLIVK